MRNKKRLYSLALMLAFGGWHSPWFYAHYHIDHCRYSPSAISKTAMSKTFAPVHNPGPVYHPRTLPQVPKCLPKGIHGVR